MAKGLPRVSLPRWKTICMALLFVQGVHAASSWRFWSKADGLAESWVFGLSAGIDGRVVAKHGDVPSDTELDGYQVTGVPSRHGYGRLRSARGSEFAPAKELWTFDTEGILILDRFGWHKYPDSDIAEFAKASEMARVPYFIYSLVRYRTPARKDRMDVVPLDSGSGIIMFPGRLLEWNRKTGAKRVIRIAAETALARFTDVEASPGGGYWVTGEHGLGQVKEVGGHLQWKEFRAPSNLYEFESPVEGSGGEVFLGARHSHSERALVRFADSRWTEVFAGGVQPLKGWRAPDGAIWIQRGDRVFQLDRDKSLNADKSEAITGLVTAVLSRRDTFWIGTTEGIARYSPPLWRNPGGAVPGEDAVKAIAADKQGRMWFLDGPFLILNDQDKWRRIPLPRGQKETLLIDNLLTLESG